MADSWKETLSEVTRTGIAAFVVVVCFFFLGVTLYYGGLNAFEQMYTLVTVFIGAILGYYFGTTGVDDANKRSLEAMKETVVVRNELSGAQTAAACLKTQNEHLMSELKEKGASQQQLDEYKTQLNGIIENARKAGVKI